MTRCDKFADRLSILALGDLSPSETQELQEHMVNCASCLTEFQGLRDLLGELKTLPLAQSRAPAFQEQGEAILEQILTEELRHLQVANPGDLFFRRQAKAIQKVLKQEARQEREGFWAAWAKPLAVAAAVFFLVLGIARITQWEGSPGTQEWNMALEYLAVEMEDEVGLETIDQLDDRQLELLANNLEGSIYVESEDLLTEEPVDLEDLNEGELDQLINRLEAKAQT